MNKFFVVLSHTYLTRLKSKAFLITTGIIIVLITLFANLDYIFDLFASDEDQKEEIIVIDETEQYFPLLKQSLETADEGIEPELFTEAEEDGKELIREEEYEGLLVISENDEGHPEGTYIENDALESWIQSTIEQHLQQIKIAIATEQAGVDEDTLATIYEPIQFEKVALDEGAKTDEELNAARGIVYVMLFVLYMTVIMYGQMIATDVATEKSSRVMEILISSASPIVHMFAKIIAIALLGLTQILAIFLFSFQLFKTKQSSFSKQMLQEFGFTADNAHLYVYAVVFFLLGYLLYATIAAMLGSLVSRVEDVQQLTMPMIFLIMIAFFIAMFGLGVPDATFITVTSYIPFFTPMIMFLRIGLLDLPTWEIALSITILVVTIIVLSILAARIYRGGVLMYGPSRSLRDFRNAFRLTKKE